MAWIVLIVAGVFEGVGASLLESTGVLIKGDQTGVGQVVAICALVGSIIAVKLTAT